MNQLEASTAIFNRWRTTWPGLSSAPSSFDNIIVPQNVLPRVTVNIISLDSDQQTMGRRAKMVREGMIDVRLYGPKGVGRGPIDQLAVYVREVYERRKLGKLGAPTTGQLNRVFTHAGTFNELVRDRESNELWIASVTFPFEFYEISDR